MFLQIWDQKSASGVIRRSCSHFCDGRAMVRSDFVIILYILERSCFGEEILINSEIAGARLIHELLMLSFD